MNPRMVLTVLLGWFVFLAMWLYVWLNQPIKDVGPCVEGMTLPARSSCTMTLKRGGST